MASTARLSPTAWLSPSPIIATPPPFMIVLTSLKSRFTRPGFVMISVRPLIDRIRTSSANLNARFSDCLGTRSSSLSFGIVITVSAASRSLSRPHSALSIRSLPSPRNGKVTTAMVRAPISLASRATYPQLPVPVPPPRPHVTKTMSAPWTMARSSSSASRAASSPICGRAPAPRPFVIRRPRRTFFGDAMWSKCCASVLHAYNSAPTIPSLYTRPIVLHPPPPRPMILIFVRILLSISSSSASTRLSSNAGALPSRASTSSNIEFIATPAEPASSSHPARWPRIRRTLFKSCRTNVRRVDKQPRIALDRRTSLEERRLRCLADGVDRFRRCGDHDDPVDDLPDLEGPAERTHLRERFHLAIVEDGDFRLRDARFAQQEFRQRDIDDDLARLHAGTPRDSVLYTPALVRILERCEHRPGGVREIVSVRREDALVELAILQPQRDLSLERPLMDEPVQELMVHHLLDVRNRCVRPFHGAREHLLGNADGLVEVHGGVHQASRDEHPLQGRKALSIQGELAAVGAERLQEAREINRPMGGARVVRVSHEIVDLVCIHRAVDDLREVALRLLPASGHEQTRAFLRRPADQVGERRGVHPVRFEHLVNPLDVREGAPILPGHVVVVARDDPLGQVHVVHRELAAQDMFQGMGERTVPDIVEEARRLDELSLLVRQAERAGHLSRDVAYAEAMLDPRMIRPREHEIRQAELPNRIESLHLERFEEVHGERIEADRPVDRVRDRLQIRHPTRQPLPPYIDSARPFDASSAESLRG